jgi:hypothetical protein
MTYEEFRLYDEPGESDSNTFKAAYLTDDDKIIYNLHYNAGGFEDLFDTFTHEWLHALFDWATIDDPNALAFNVHDCTGDSDHFIMKIINYG